MGRRFDSCQARHLKPFGIRRSGNSHIVPMADFRVLQTDPQTTIGFFLRLGRTRLWISRVMSLACLSIGIAGPALLPVDHATFAHDFIMQEGALRAPFNFLR